MVPTEVGSMTPSNVPTLADSFAPSFSFMPSVARTDILIYIVTDDFPEEISWELRDLDGGLLTKGGNFTYLQRRSAVETEYNVVQGKYILKMIDSRADGICCLYGEGRVAVYLGDKVDGNKTVLYQYGDYGAEKEFEFLASPAGIFNITRGPTFAPTTSQAPSDAPPSNMPSDSPPSDMPSDVPSTPPTLAPSDSRMPSLRPSITVVEPSATPSVSIAPTALELVKVLVVFHLDLYPGTLLRQFNFSILFLFSQNHQLHFEHSGNRLVNSD
jgi:hypothetical protein